MSHNTNKVNAQVPNISGVVAVALSQLSNVNASSPAPGEVLKFVGANWVAASPPDSGYVSNNYAAGWSSYNASSGSSYSSSGSLDSYRTHTYVNWSEANADGSRYQKNAVITRGTHGGATPTQVRFSRLELTTGRYLLFATTRSPIGNSANYIEWQWLNTTDDAALGPKWRQYGSTVDDVGYGIGYINVTSGTSICDVRVLVQTGGTDVARDRADILGALRIG